MSHDPASNSPAVAILRKNSIEEIRIALTEFRGHNLVDVRTYTEARADGGRRVPTKAGISLKIALLPELIEALQRAERKARDAGFLDDER